MYQVTLEPVTWIEVKWKALDEQGFEQEHSFDMQVALLPASEVEGIVGGETETPTVAFAKKVGRNWRKIVAEGGKPFPFTPANVDLVFEHSPGLKTGFVVSYLLGWQGKGKVREKNSKGSPPDGPAGQPTPRRRASKSS